MCSLARARVRLPFLVLTEIFSRNRLETAHRHAAAARQCCAPIPGYPVIATKLELAMNATEIRGPGA